MRELRICIQRDISVFTREEYNLDTTHILFYVMRERVLSMFCFDDCFFQSGQRFKTINKNTRHGVFLY